MHIHILGICGTFMGGLAQLARQLGMEVSGCDAGAWPPMSTQLQAAGIKVISGYDAGQLDAGADIYVIGNCVSRGNPLAEAVLNGRRQYDSGPAFLARQVLAGRRVLACAGTHGKTSQASMLAWILQCAGREPGFLIGGVPHNFGASARLGAADAPFVVEADEYDSAFFDKRSKFIHYRPDGLVLNNLEWDHADIFADLGAVQTQFAHLLRTVPGDGLVLCNGGDRNLAQVLERGCWTAVQSFGTGDRQCAWDWRARPLADDWGGFQVLRGGDAAGSVKWAMQGWHSAHNALGALALAAWEGVPVNTACDALASYKGAARRMDLLWQGGEPPCRLHDDFAHHPTAIAATLEGLRARVGDDARVLAIIEPRSNSMRMNAHGDSLADCAGLADRRIWYKSPDCSWPPQADAMFAALGRTGEVKDNPDAVLAAALEFAAGGGDIVMMSNGDFDRLPQRIKQELDK